MNPSYFIDHIRSCRRKGYTLFTAVLNQAIVRSFVAAPNDCYNKQEQECVILHSYRAHCYNKKIN